MRGLVKDPKMGLPTGDRKTRLPFGTSCDSEIDLAATDLLNSAGSTTKRQRKR